MTERTIALFRDPWSALEAAPASYRQPLVLWRKAMWFKANPRSASYMIARLAEHWPEAEFVDTASEPNWERALSGADRVVLLYPDAIGIGFGQIERRVLRRVPRRAIAVLNGRRRMFPLDRPTRSRLLLRRFLERSMLTECLLGIVVLVATPFLFLIDRARGHR